MILAVPLRTLGNSAIEKCCGLLLLGRYGFMVRTNTKRDAMEICASALPSWPMRISPAPPFATFNMTGAPFHVLIGSIPMIRNSPIGWSKY